MVKSKATFNQSWLYLGILSFKISILSIIFFLFLSLCLFYTDSDVKFLQMLLTAIQQYAHYILIHSDPDTANQQGPAH
jgi:hypothetical protein